MYTLVPLEREKDKESTERDGERAVTCKASPPTPTFLSLLVPAYYIPLDWLATLFSPELSRLSSGCANGHFMHVFCPQNHRQKDRDEREGRREKRIS